MSLIAISNLEDFVRKCFEAEECHGYFPATAVDLPQDLP